MILLESSDSSLVDQFDGLAIVFALSSAFLMRGAITLSRSRRVTASGLEGSARMDPSTMVEYMTGSARKASAIRSNTAP